MTDKATRQRGLGRGLSALMADVAGPARADGAPSATDRMVPIDRLHPNPDQPRRQFAPVELQELADSIRQKGVIQPLIVRANPSAPDTYQIVAGERRWRAAQLAGVHELPVILRTYDDREVLEIAIIENIQRAELNAIEEAASYRSLIDRFGHTQDMVATALGKSRSHIANLLRLLTLPEEVQVLVRSGTLTAGHARALIGHPEAAALARRIAIDKLTVRDAEALARKPFAQALRDPVRPPPQPKDPDTIALENELSASLRMGVTIDQDKDKESGRLILRYHDLAQLDDLLRALSGH
jgi:ParB family transcriptional regulator, chromosome partitioning protein